MRWLIVDKKWTHLECIGVLVIFSIFGYIPITWQSALEYFGALVAWFLFCAVLSGIVKGVSKK